MQDSPLQLCTKSSPRKKNWKTVLQNKGRTNIMPTKTNVNLQDVCFEIDDKRHLRNGVRERFHFEDKAEEIDCQSQVHPILLYFKMVWE